MGAMGIRSGTTLGLFCTRKVSKLEMNCGSVLGKLSVLAHISSLTFPRLGSVASNQVSPKYPNRLTDLPGLGALRAHSNYMMMKKHLKIKPRLKRIKKMLLKLQLP